jgi:cytochrome c-type biogenesis protein CcmF
LSPGDTTQLGDYQFTYEGLSERNQPQRTVTMANMRVRQVGGSSKTTGEPTDSFVMHPGRARFHASPNMPTSEIDIVSTPLEDVYIALVNFSPDGRSAAFKMFINPFTWWLWAGGVILVLGTLIAMWPTREGLENLRTSPAILGRLAVFTGLVALSLLPLVVWQIESDTDWGSAQRWARTLPAQEAPTSQDGTPRPDDGESTR